MNYYELYNKPMSVNWGGGNYNQSLVCCAVGEAIFDHWYDNSDARSREEVQEDINWTRESIKETKDRLKGTYDRSYWAERLVDLKKELRALEKELKEFKEDKNEPNPVPKIIEDALDDNYSWVIFSCVKNTSSWKWKEEVEGLPNIVFLGENTNKRSKNQVFLYALNLKADI